MELIAEKLTEAKQKATNELDILSQAIIDPHSSMRKLVKGSLYKFLQYFWPQYSDDDFISNWHIEYICEELEIVARRVAAGLPKEYDLIINVPPGSTKTAIVSIMFPLWCWVNWYWMRFITASYTAPLSLESAEYSRDIMRSDAWKRLFPELDIKQDKDTKSNFRIVKKIFHHRGQTPRLDRGGNRFSTSVSGTVMGFHGHINIWDDPIKPEGAISEAEIKKANYWMTNTLPFRKVDKRVTVTIGIMQRLHQNDPTGFLLREKKWAIKHICLPGEIRNYKDNVKPKHLTSRYTEDGLLDGKRLDWIALKELEKLGQYTYSGQVGQNPVPLGGGMFETDHIMIVDRVPMQIDETVRYWDKAATDGSGAWTVGVKMARLVDGRWIILDVKRGQWGTNKRERIIKECAMADGQKVKVYVEQEPGSGGKDSVKATIMNLAGFAIYADRPTGDKAIRADPYSVQVNDGNVLMLRAMWNDIYIDELENFPFSVYKDQTDASSGAFNKLTQLRKVTVLKR